MNKIKKKTKKQYPLKKILVNPNYKSKPISRLFPETNNWYSANPPVRLGSNFIVSTQVGAGWIEKDFTFDMARELCLIFSIHSRCTSAWVFSSNYNKKTKNKQTSIEKETKKRVSVSNLIPNLRKCKIVYCPLQS